MQYLYGPSPIKAILAPGSLSMTLWNQIHYWQMIALLFCSGSKVVRTKWVTLKQSSHTLGRIESRNMTPSVQNGTGNYDSVAEEFHFKILLITIKKYWSIATKPLLDMHINFQVKCPWEHLQQKLSDTSFNNLAQYMRTKLIESALPALSYLNF